jgi:NADPH-dependent 2,4-dienoyl-CoA reductase/sulfur reductase-like enzyme
MRFVIIGGDAAGMSAASRARRLDPALDVIVLEKTADVSYSACGMPYNIADPVRSMDDLVVRPADVFRQKSGIDLRTRHCVTQIDPEHGTVTCKADDGGAVELAYDRLLIATGAAPVLPDRPGFDRPGVMALKSLDQGRRIKAFIKERGVRRVLIVGMGYIALEMAEALRARGIEVEMVKPRPDLLPWLDRQLAAEVEQELTGNRVRLNFGRSVASIVSAGDRLRALDADGALIGDQAVDMVLVAMGVKPNSGLAGRAGLALGPAGAIAVDRQMRTSHERIYAAGDCADAYHVVTGRKTWIPLALRANRGGWAVADHVCGRAVDIPGVAGTAVFKVFGLQVARTGLGGPEAADSGFDPVSTTTVSHSRAHSHPGGSRIHVHMIGDRRSGRLLGVQMVGREGVAHRINAAAVALHAAMPVDRFVQCDLAYAPPFGGVWDPLLVAANQLMKAL